MKPIAKADRRIANIREAEYEPWIDSDGTDSRTAILQLGPQRPIGTGFHVYRMEPGSRSEAHEHTEHEEFLVLEGELIECDGTVYRPGDLVWLRKGTQHTSHTETGCLLAVYIAKPEINLPEE